MLLEKCEDRRRSSADCLAFCAFFFARAAFVLALASLALALASFVLASVSFSSACFLRGLRPHGLPARADDAADQGEKHK